MSDLFDALKAREKALSFEGAQPSPAFQKAIQMIKGAAALGKFKLEMKQYGTMTDLSTADTIRLQDLGFQIHTEFKADGRWGQQYIVVEW